jgi:dUTP pyrophosphatase
MELRIKQLDSRARLPRRAHYRDAGLDMAPVDGAVITPGQTVRMTTGIAAEVPYGHFGLLLPRSSAKEAGLDITGVIDSDYRGPIAISATNIGEGHVHVMGGQFIAQLIIIPCVTPHLTITDDLSETPRGASGFGSSGQ